MPAPNPLRTRTHPLAVGAVLVAAVAGLAAADLPEFSHELHLDEGAECDTCHSVGNDHRAPQLNPEACIDCHDEAMAYDFPAKARRLGAAFDHRLHGGEMACTGCHAGIPSDAITAGEPMAEQTDCTGCHGDRQVKLSPRKCEACHEPNARLVQPADHKQAWTRRHGSEARWRVFDEHGRDCEQCHDGSATCNSCHRERRPRDHNALWANRMHGSAAAWDRDRCKTCHASNVCISCHRTSTPPSHRGAWQARHGRVAGGFDNNCRVCHQRAWCTNCHRGER